MAVWTRDLSVTYAGLTIGGSSAYHWLFDRHRVYGSYDEIGFEGRVLVRGATAAEFATKCAELEAAFTTPNGTLTISQESQTLKSFGHSASTGMLGRPSFRKVGGPEDSGRARLYEVRVVAQRPADASGKAGLRVAQFALETTFFGSRSYRVSGTYTAIGGTDARDKYEAAIGALLTSLEGDLTGDWQRMESSVRWDDENKIATFDQVGVEIGLRDGRYSISSDETGLRAYTVSGTYTANDGQGQTAAAAFLASIGDVLDDLEAGLGGEFERGPVRYEYDQGEKLCRFDCVGLELRFNQASGVLNHPAITGQRLFVARRETAPGDAADARRPIELLVSYEASIVRSETEDLKSLWDSTIKPYLVDHARTIAVGGQAALLEVDPVFDHPRNRISAALLIQVYDGGTILSHSVETEDDSTTGVALAEVYAEDGLAAVEFDAPIIRVRIITETIMRLGAAGGGSAAAPLLGGKPADGGQAGAAGSGSDPKPPGVGKGEAGYRLLRTIRTARPERRGLNELAVDVVVERFVHILRYRNPVGSKGGGQAGGGQGGKITGDSGDGRVETVGGAA